jgi:hypothetical protein
MTQTPVALALTEQHYRNKVAGDSCGDEPERSGVSFSDAKQGSCNDGVLGRFRHGGHYRNGASESAGTDVKTRHAAAAVKKR